VSGEAPSTSIGASSSVPEVLVPGELVVVEDADELVAVVDAALEGFGVGAVVGVVCA
jgi:hypothetical protein